jgi:hypothetical protein
VKASIEWVLADACGEIPGRGEAARHPEGFCREQGRREERNHSKHADPDRRLQRSPRRRFSKTPDAFSPNCADLWVAGRKDAGTSAMLLRWHMPPTRKGRPWAHFKRRPR